MGSQNVHKIPTLDLTKEDLKSGTSSWTSACNDVRCALEEYGCFVVLYQKVSPEIHKEVFGGLEGLFEIPLEIKMKNTSEKPYHGYIGQYPSLPNFEALGMDNPTLIEGCKSFTNRMWPNGNNHFCETAHLFAKQVAELNKMVMSMVFESYGLEKMNDSFDEVTTYLLRMMRYLVPKSHESKLGNPPHTDKSFTTILHQNGVNGLEIQAKDGEWIGVGLSTSSFLFMAGDALMAWSNGRIHSANHRVTMQSGSEPRYSLGLFSFRGGVIQTPKELVDEEHPLQYKPFDNIGLIHFYFTEEGRKANCLVKAYCGV